MAVTSWSHSKLTDFEQCKKRFWLKHDQRIPEPQRPLPTGKSEHANDRGTRIHLSCEDYVAGRIHELTWEADKHFGPQIDLLRTMHEDGLVHLEGEWGHDSDWSPWPWSGQWVELDAETAKTFADEYGYKLEKLKALPERASRDSVYEVKGKVWVWQDAWLRLKIDALVLHDDKTATVIDYKTGRKFGNEMKHAEQLQLYQLATFSRYPQLETVYAELWYLDQDEVTSQRYDRTMGLRYRDKFTKRGDALLSCTSFPPNANVITCKWCMYGPWGSNDCPAGVRPDLIGMPGKRGR